MRKFYIQTQGCQMNEYDSELMAALLCRDSGMEQVDSPEAADLLLLNTCAIREKAQEKVFHQLGRWRRLKERRPEVIIGVGGCVASQEGENIGRRAGFVDMVFGPQTLHRLPELVKARQESQIRVVDVTFPELEKFDRLPTPEAGRASAYVSIMEGCSKYCSFCVVPYTRGEEWSRPARGVLAEIEGLAAQGIREVNLLGQNVNAWRGQGEEDEGMDLAELLEHVALIPGIERIRFTTSHPAEFNDDLIAAFSSVAKLADHLHLPVQSGSDRILQLMKRGYRRADYLEIIRGLREARPNLSISSDFIVGFPGETEEDFEATMSLVEAVGFDSSFSFVYSPRPGTPAALMEDETPEETKLQRLQRLQRRLRQQAEVVSQGMVGNRERILVSGHSSRNERQMQGRTSNHKIVNFFLPDTELSEQLKGGFVEVEITEALPNCLLGTLL